MDPRMTYGRAMNGVGTTVSYTGTAGNTSVAPTGAEAVRVLCTTDAYVEIGLGVTAVAGTGMYMAAGVAEYFAITPGERVSAIQVGAGGTCAVSFFN
jgi:hypothetical protein